MPGLHYHRACSRLGINGKKSFYVTALQLTHSTRSSLIMTELYFRDGQKQIIFDSTYLFSKTFGRLRDLKTEICIMVISVYSLLQKKNTYFGS